MASLNKVLLIGNVGKDPEIRYTQDASEIANLSLATSESWKDKMTGERKEKTQWHKVVIFNDNLVQVIKNYVKKGSKLYIEGTLQTRKWTDKNGDDKYSTEVVLQGFGGSIVLLDKGEAVSEHSKAKADGYVKQEGAALPDDEIPFAIAAALVLPLTTLLSAGIV